MTHPFHPLCGQEFELLEYRNAWGEERVYFLNREGKIEHFPATWTDRVDPDPFVVIAAGRSPFHIDALMQLANLIENLKKGGTKADGTV